MNIKGVKQPEQRIDTPSISNLDILSFGHNNLYPQDMKGIVACSETGEGCLDRYKLFIQGNGFYDTAVSESIVNRQGDTLDDILQHIADDLGDYSGLALHVNYNLLGDIVEVNHIPFENCRLGVEDENGYVSKIAVHPDWTGSKKRNNKVVRPSKDNVDYIDVFNPDRAIVQAQIELAGGIEAYKGQILWISRAGRQEYPKAKYDKVLTQMSTEEGLGNIAYRNTRNNFLPSGMFITRKGLDTPNADDRSSYYSQDDSITQSLIAVQGDDKANLILHVEVEHDEEIPHFEPFEGRNYDEDFTVTSDTVCEKIYAAFGQEAWHRIRKGSVGFSAEIMQDTYDVYNSETNSERRMVERAFDKIFKHWYENLPSYDFSIEPQKYISSNASDNN